MLIFMTVTLRSVVHETALERRGFVKAFKERGEGIVAEKLL